MHKWRVQPTFMGAGMLDSTQVSDEFLAIHLMETRALLGTYLKNVRLRAAKAGRPSLSIAQLAHAARVSEDEVLAMEHGIAPRSTNALANMFLVYATLTPNNIDPVFYLAMSLTMFELDSAMRD